MITLDTSTKAPSMTLSNNNLTMTNTTATGVLATEGKLSGKWYWEVNSTTAGVMSGVAVSDVDTKIVNGFSGNMKLFAMYNANGVLYGNGKDGTAYGTNFITGEVIGVLLDLDNGTLAFRKNGIDLGVAYNTLNSIQGDIVPVLWSGTTVQTRATINFGRDGFTYQVPNGYKGLDFKNRKMTLKNPTTNQYYSLSEKTLIPLPNVSNKNMILFGIEVGKEIRLDEEFDKINYPVESGLKNTVKTMVKPLSIKFE